jgi:GTP-binding protein
MADIPGLIEGAHQGSGLGTSFLRHIRRCRLLLHLLDASRDDLLSDYNIVNNELKLYDEKLADYPQLVAINKIDLLSPEGIRKKAKKLREKGIEPFLISALKGDGVQKLIYEINNRLKAIKKANSRINNLKKRIGF